MCHMDLYDTLSLGWSNVGCVLREDPWFPIVDSFGIGGLCAFASMPGADDPGIVPIVSKARVKALGKARQWHGRALQPV